MNHFMFQSFVYFCCLLFLAGCVFSWKPNVSDSTVSVNDNTSLEVPRETKEEH